MNDLVKTVAAMIVAAIGLVIAACTLVGCSSGVRLSGIPDSSGGGAPAPALDLPAAEVVARVFYMDGETTVSRAEIVVGAHRTLSSVGERVTTATLTAGPTGASASISTSHDKRTIGGMWGAFWGSVGTFLATKGL